MKSDQIYHSRLNVIFFCGLCLPPCYMYTCVCLCHAAKRTGRLCYVSVNLPNTAEHSLLQSVEGRVVEEIARNPSAFGLATWTRPWDSRLDLRTASCCQCDNSSPFHGASMCHTLPPRQYEWLLCLYSGLQNWLFLCCRVLGVTAVWRLYFEVRSSKRWHASTSITINAWTGHATSLRSSYAPLTFISQNLQTHRLHRWFHIKGKHFFLLYTEPHVDHRQCLLKFLFLTSFLYYFRGVL